MSVAKAVKADLKRFTPELRGSAEAAAALALGQRLDDDGTNSAEAASCVRALGSLMEGLRARMPVVAEEVDLVDELRAQRAKRRERGAAS